MLGDVASRPGAEEVSANYVWLRPMVEYSPTKVLSFVKKNVFTTRKL